MQNCAERPPLSADKSSRAHAEVSVIVTTVDRPAELGRCLDAILAGDVLPTELIVVDQGNGCAGAVVQERSDRGVRVVYVRQARKGLSAARNTGLAEARSPIVAVTDDDCCPDPNWIATVAALLQAPGAPQAVTGQVVPLGPESPDTYAVSSRTSPATQSYTWTTRPWNIGTGGNCAVSREWMLQGGGYDERLGAGSPGKAAEDIDFFYRLVSSGGVIRYDPRLRVYHARQSKAARAASRSTYGYGIGAFCGIRMGAGDARAAAVLLRWFGLRVKLLLTYARRRDWHRASEELVVLRSTFPGFRYGLRAHGPREARA